MPDARRPTRKRVKRKRPRAPQPDKTTPGLRKRRLLIAADPHCRYCRVPLTDETATLDHVVPRSRGGSNAIENLVLSCKPCNEAKGSLTIDEFLRIRYFGAVAQHLGHRRR